MKKYLEFINENYIELKPSDFANISPMSSVFNVHEYEIIAQNIMKILMRTGNKFRKLSWDEYKKERQKDGSFTESEKWYFDKVVDHCIYPENAINFSKYWNIKAEAEKDAEIYNL